MKKIIFITILGFLMQFSIAQSEKLTNQSIVDMVELGFESDVIISKIQNTESSFDVNIDALKNLKNKGVDPSVLSAMVKASGAKEASKVAKTGIYILKDSVETQILPTVFSGSRTNTLAAALSYGIASAKTKSIIQNIASSNVISVGKSSFKFYFKPNQDSNFGKNIWWFQASTSPSEFALIVLDVNQRKNCREIEVGSINMWAGVSTGVKDKHVVDIVIEKLEDGVFLVTTKDDLPIGEYCFYYKGVVPQGGYNNQSAFDFSVQ